MRTVRAALAALVLVLLAPPAWADDPVSPPRNPGDRWGFGWFAEIDLGILIAFRGISVTTGPSYGPFRASVGFAAFDSKIPALSGAPDGFGLRVASLWSINLDAFPWYSRYAAPYARLAVQTKSQVVTNLATGDHATLSSWLVGPEIGLVLRPIDYVYVAPKTGLLLYLKKPQPGGFPVRIGDRDYDNRKHQAFDFYYTAALGAGT